MAVVFALLGIGCMVGMYYLYTTPNDSGPIYIPRILLGLPIICLLGVILAMVNIASNKKGLTISAQGLTLNYGMNKFGPIAWNTILHAEQKRYMLNNFIVVYLENPGAFMATRTGLSKRMYSENHSTHGSPVVINTSQLNTTADELVSDIKQRIENAKK